ncbi:MAG: DUF2796 domain-containing protein [Burkholderiales bacterium]|nr:DUF2796 domain-containing protein [Burkholderiales bacterium]
MNRTVCLACCLALPAAAAQVHEHGAATLEVAVDGGTITIALESPLDTLVGFEHAPREEKQRAALRKMEASLRAGDRMFRPTAAAGCTAGEAKVEHPYAGGAAARTAHAHGADGHKNGKHGHGKDEQHAGAHATWTFVCTSPQALRELEVLVFDAFPGVKRIRAQTATPRGQAAVTLTPSRRRLAL